MKICGFDKVFDILDTKRPSAGVDDRERYKKKVRDKYAEIIEAIGINKNLLQAKEKIVDVDGNTIRAGAYILPEQSVEFCAAVIEKYTSADFKKLRKANFDGMSVEEISFLVCGFTRMLRYLGYTEEEILTEYKAMDRRMKYKLRLADDELKHQLSVISELALEYERNGIGLTYCDKIYFLHYMANKIKAVKGKIESVYGGYIDLRYDEISEIALNESTVESSRISTEKIHKEMIFFDALEKDDKYQKLLKRLYELITEDTFIKNKQNQFKKIKTELLKIRHQHQMELFDELLDEEETGGLTLSHPLNILIEAIKDVEATDKYRAEREEAEAAKTPEDVERENATIERIRQKLEEQGGLTADLPNTDEQEEEIFVQSGNLRGIVKIPCFCKNRKITVYNGTGGKCAMKCPACGCYVIVDFDKMTANQLDLYGRSVQRIKKRDN